MGRRRIHIDYRWEIENLEDQDVGAGYKEVVQNDLIWLRIVINGVLL
jgi:hypothetical protein